MGTHYSAPIFLINETEIKIATGSRGSGTLGESQTINVFDDTHTEGHYREVYRILNMENYVNAVDVRVNATDLQQLEQYLLARGATKEGTR